MRLRMVFFIVLLSLYCVQTVINVFFAIMSDPT